jgi:hypothetical protein
MSGRRETVMQALFALLQTAYPWVSTSRRIKLWGDVPLTARPAMFLFEGAHDVVSWKSQQVNPIIVMGADCIVYTNAKDPALIGAALINEIFDAIHTALTPGPTSLTGSLTLGGLVNQCRIDGQVLKVPGDLDGDGMLWVPIKIDLPL